MAARLRKPGSGAGRPSSPWTAATVSSAGLVVTLSERRIVPYVVTVDKLGSALAVGRADEAVLPERAVTVAGLARFIADMRSVYVDAAAERAILKEGYAMINRRSDAYAAMNAHMRAHDPFERARSETVTVEVHSVLPISAQTWRVERRKRDGTEPASTEMQATITLDLQRTLRQCACRCFLGRTPD